jgi:predicted 2-oxoglutarate/Fe(II)-dependent dioxygenase YbiX/peroxiredoxin
MARLLPGDPAPYFTVRASTNPNFHFDTAGGRNLVLSFIGSAARPGVAEAVQRLGARRDIFDDIHASLFVVTCDPTDEGRLEHRMPGYRNFWDFDSKVTRLYGLASEPEADGRLRVTPASVVLDPNFRVFKVVPMTDPAAHADEVVAYVATLPRRKASELSHSPAPILVVPRVFEPEFCRELIRLYESHGGEDSGFMQTDPASGNTIARIDYRHKRRRDHAVADPKIQDAIRTRVLRRVVPELKKAFQYEATRIERYLIACYDAAEGGYFRPHRDNTTLGTAHRRFAVTLNLNAEEYEGGDLRFPEYDTRTYRAPTGGAVVFSCSMLHEATPVMRGRRYAVLPFLYDDAAAEIREANKKYLADP